MIRYKIPFLLLILSILVLTDASAQYQSLKGNKDQLDIKIIGGPYLELGRAADQFTVFAGVEAGVLFNKKLILGAYGSSCLGGYYPVAYDDREEYRNYFEQGGLWAAYLFEPNEIVHAQFQIKTGIGNLAIGEDLGDEFLNITCYIYQPSFGLELNMTNYLKMGIDMHYRLVNPLDIYLYKNGSLNGAGIALSFRFSNFN